MGEEKGTTSMLQPGGGKEKRQKAGGKGGKKKRIPLHLGRRGEEFTFEGNATRGKG